MLLGARRQSSKKINFGIGFNSPKRQKFWSCNISWCAISQGGAIYVAQKLGEGAIYVAQKSGEGAIVVALKPWEGAIVVALKLWEGAIFDAYIGATKIEFHQRLLNS